MERETRECFTGLIISLVLALIKTFEWLRGGRPRRLSFDALDRDSIRLSLNDLVCHLTFYSFIRRGKSLKSVELIVTSAVSSLFQFSRILSGLLFSRRILEPG